MTDYIGKPLKKDSGKAAAPQEAEPITPETIYNCIAAPVPSDITTILTTLLNTSDITSCLSNLNQIKANRGLALADIVTALAAEVQKVEVPAATRVAWMEGLAEVEWRLAGGGSETIQTGGLVGVIRKGVEAMEG